jgi:hypothetical protein
MATATATATATASHQRRDALPTDVVIEMARAAGMKVDDLSQAARVGFVEAAQSAFGTVEGFAAFLADPEGAPPAAPEPLAPVDVSPASTGGAAPVATTTRRTRIMAILAGADAPMPSADIIAALRASGDAVARPEAAYNELRRMVDSMALVKLGEARDARYGLPDRAYELADSAADGDAA